MKKIFRFLLTVVVFSFTSLFVSALAFPSISPGVNIGTNLEAGYEPSGVVWHERLQSLFTIWDNGYVTQMDMEGNIMHSSVFVGGDLEGIAVADDASNYIYLLQEYPQKIVEFDISTWTKTSRSWTLNGMVGNTASGAEALTYNTDKESFYVGSQYDGNIYVYDVSLAVLRSTPPVSPTSVSLNPVSIITTGISNDLAGLSYLAEVGRTYAVFDASNKIQEYDAEDKLVVEYDLPGLDQEGVTVLPGCPNSSTTMVIAQDSGGVIKYSGYPIACPVQAPVDGDMDGFNVDLDCDDNNAAVNFGMTEITNDGLNNDCDVSTPDWVKLYDYSTLIPYKTTEVRGDYHVFDSKSEFSYVKIPSQLVSGWYTFELEARATTLDGLYSLGVYVRTVDGRFTETRIVDGLDWKTYKFYTYIPANTPTEVRFISGVRGIDLAGTKREHHLRAVTLSRVEEAVDPMVLPVVTVVDAVQGKSKVILNVKTDIEASHRLLFNGLILTDTNLVTERAWTLKGLTCGTTYDYEIQLFSDLYHTFFNNMVTQAGSVSTAACSI